MKKITFKEFKNLWEGIEACENGYLSLGLGPTLNVHIGYHSLDSKSLVLLDTGIIKDIPSSYAIEAKNVRLQNGSYAVEFRLMKNLLNDTFLRLCWDMIDYSETSKEPIMAFINRYISWQKLLQYMKTEGLTYKRQKGLIGELLFLKGVLKTENYHTVVSAWTGPDGCDQDFQFSDTWAEIKTVSMAAESVAISSLQQLDNPMKGTLEVYFLEKASEGSGRLNLYALVEEIRGMFDRDLLLLDRFNLKLYKYGFRDEEREEYEKNYYRLTKYQTYNVDDYFPKIIRSNVMTGIQECKYSLSIEYLDKYRKR